MTDGKYRYYLPLQVRYADTDAQGHVFFANYLTYFDEALGGYFRAFNFPWQALFDMGLDIFYVDTGCQYKASASYADLLHVHAHMARIGNTSFTTEFAITQEVTGELLATGHITAVVVNPTTRKPQRVPDALRDAVAAYEEGPPEDRDAGSAVG